MRYAVIVALVFVAGCAGSSPTAPTPAAPPPSVIGQWIGSYTITTCTEAGAANGSGFCRSLGNGGGLTWTPQQAGTNVTGTMSVGGYTPIAATGTVGTDNIAALTGSGPIQFGASLALSSFRGVIAGSSISGTLAYTITTPDPIGSASVTGIFTMGK